MNRPLFIVASALLAGALAAPTAHAQLHGDDTRLEPDDADPAGEISRAMAQWVDRQNVRVEADGRLRLATNVNACAAGQRFAGQDRVPGCTAFLIGPDRMITALSCLDADGDGVLGQAEIDGYCDTHIGIFDRRITGGAQPLLTEASAIGCRAVGMLTTVPGDDLAVLHLERDAGRAPVRIASQFPEGYDGGLGPRVGVPSFAGGLPLKFDRATVESVSGSTARVRLSGGTLRVGLDGDVGTPGAPLIDDDGRVFGVITRPGQPSPSAAAMQCLDEIQLDAATAVAFTRWTDISQADAAEIGGDDRYVVPLRPDGTAGTYASINHVIGVGDDIDGFAVPTQPGDRVQIHIAFAHADGDLDLWVRDASTMGMLRAQSVTDDESLSVYAQGDAVHFEVYGFDGAVNAYTVSVRIDPAPTVTAVPGGAMLGSVPAACGGPEVLTCGALEVCLPRSPLVEPARPGAVIDLRHALGRCAPAGSTFARLPLETAHPYGHQMDAGWRIYLPDWVGRAEMDISHADFETGWDFLRGDRQDPATGRTGQFSGSMALPVGRARPAVAQPAPPGTGRARMIEPGVVTDHSVDAYGLEAEGLFLHP